MTDDNDEPLPPLESDDPEWVAARRGAYLAGARHHWQSPDAPPRRRTTSAFLRSYQADEALVDVYCGQHLVARVARTAESYEVVTDPVPVRAAQDASIVLGWGFERADLRAAERVAVGCRCGVHVLSTRSLMGVARRAVPGRPERTRVGDVTVD